MAGFFEWFTAEYDSDPVRGVIAGGAVVHGTQDPALPLVYGRQTFQSLESLGIHPAYGKFDMGHAVTDESISYVATHFTGLAQQP